MNSVLRLLGIRGLGNQRLQPWQQEWQAALLRAIPAELGLELECHFLSYDDMFEDIDSVTAEAAAAKLLRSETGKSAISAIKGLFDVPDNLKWAAGYLVAWLDDEALKTRSRDHLFKQIEEFRPDILLCHSLGSLVAYDALSCTVSSSKTLQALLENLSCVSFGSQIGNPFVAGHLTSGRIKPLRVKRWIHLYNRYDKMFTAPIRLWEAENFGQIDTPFSSPGRLNHAGHHYLAHEATIEQLWRPLAAETCSATRSKKKPKKPSCSPDYLQGPVQPMVSPGRRRSRQKRYRALLTGINNYPNHSDRLDGCVNDAFLVSEVLQEYGFPPEGIRLCLDERATAEGILDRLEWLLDDPGPGDQLFFFYSGHGAQLHTYGEADSIDRRDETLVPYDFDWSPDTSITDDQIYRLYSQLPYDTQFIMAFDCCHSGGIHRSGQPRAKGLNPPDDIRHRGLRWNSDLRMWERRELGHMNNAFARSHRKKSNFFGDDGATARLGRASAVRHISEKTYKSLKKSSGETPVGPYLPMIFEACQEDEFAYEYRHGVISYGAFTYAMASGLRAHRHDSLTFSELLLLTRETMQRLGYNQRPNILGPSVIMDSQIPW